MKVVSIVLLGLLTGCASFLSGGKQSVAVTTPGVDGASCILTDAVGRVSEIASTPGTAKVARGDGPITVICKKSGYDAGTGQLNEGLAPAVFGNILLPIGFLIDSFTGSAQKYSSSVEVEMEPMSSKASSKPWE